VSINSLFVVGKKKPYINDVSIDAQVDAEQVGPGAKIAGNYSLQCPKSQTGCLFIMSTEIKYFVFFL
jgi:hypothetical protein